MGFDAKEIDRFINEALKAREKAYAPYSGFAVGAVAVTSDGKFFPGANVENASYGLTICAERMAIGKAVNAGFTTVEAVVVVGGYIDGPDTSARTIPCGACLQVMAEFMGDGSTVIAAALNGTYDIYKFKELLPKAFRLEGKGR